MHHKARKTGHFRKNFKNILKIHFFFEYLRRITKKGGKYDNEKIEIKRSPFKR